MNPLNDYFSDRNIIHELCKQRIKLADKRHQRTYVPRLAGVSYLQPIPHEVDFLLPPRAQWNAFRPRHRQGSQAPILKALVFATHRLRESCPNQPWVIRLNHFMSELRDRALNLPDPRFSQPRMFWELKKGHEYRPLSQFPLADSIILSLLAKYLTDFFDPVYSPNSYAFRSRSENPEMPTRETAINALFDLRRSSSTDLYVAECDIKKFFDCVEHGVALEAFNSSVKSMRANWPDRILNPRARALFQAYLNCYDFPGVVLRDTLPRLRQKDAAGEFPWPTQELRDVWKQDPRQMRIGVPQGGAVSGVIANLVLNQADQQVEAVNRSGSLHYFRYCDDTLFVSTSRKQCGQGLDVYLSALTVLKLPFHQLVGTRFYGKDFWNQKSKAPYCWSGRKWFGCVPWVQFIGYQIRYDGLMRPRKESVNKQKLRIRERVDEAKFGMPKLARIGLPIKASEFGAVMAVYHRLACVGVGRVRKGQAATPMPKCWTGGFKALHNKPVATRSLQLLDRERERLARRFKRAEVSYGEGKSKRGGWSRKGNAATESTASYCAQFDNASGDDLVRNPYRPTLWEKRVMEPVYMSCRWFAGWRKGISVVQKRWRYLVHLVRGSQCSNAGMIDRIWPERFDTSETRET